MGTKTNDFTEEQIFELSANPYTHSVSKHKLRFTVEFKEFFASQMDKPGMTTRKILQAAGYNTDYIGEYTMTNLRHAVRTEMNSPEGFKDPFGKSDKEKTKEFSEKDLSQVRENAAIKELQDRIVHLEQQIEFLKKISNARNSARRKDTTQD